MNDILQNMKKKFDCFIDKADSFIKSQTPSIPASAVCCFVDGDQWCCVFGDFINLQESPAGFGKTPEEALNSLLIKLNPQKEEPVYANANLLEILGQWCLLARFRMPETLSDGLIDKVIKVRQCGGLTTYFTKTGIFNFCRPLTQAEKQEIINY